MQNIIDENKRIMDELHRIIGIADVNRGALIDDPKYVNALLRQALADVALASAKALADVGVKVQTEDEQKGLSKFLMCDDIRIFRFRGANFVKLIGKRPAKDGNPNMCYEIRCDKSGEFDHCHRAHIYRNEDLLMTITTHLGSCMLEKVAISAFKRLYHERKLANKRRNDSRKRKNNGILTPAEELSETVKRQQEM